MADNDLKVFIVDDDDIARDIAAIPLRDEGHRITEFASGDELLKAASADPDIVLLDIEMPGMDGIETCRRLREAGSGSAQILFVSAHDDLDTRLAAYGAGGTDFIVKPYDPEELVQKVRVAAEFLARRRELSSQAQYAQQAAFTAMSSMGEMGAVLQFLHDSFACTGMAQLAQRIFAALADYGLRGLASFRTAAGEQHYSPAGEATPLEASILRHARSMDRIFQFRDRLAVNYPAVTVLVFDLPLADGDRVGRLRDHLAILVEGADARLRALDTEMRNRRQAEGILKVVGELTGTLAELERRQASNRAESMQISAEFMRELTNAFVHLGLSDDQETALAAMAQQAHGRLEALMDDDRFLSDQLLDITSRLKALTGG